MLHNNNDNTMAAALSSPAWKDQRLDVFDKDPSTGCFIGIPQRANGPCGVLAVLQGEMWMAFESLQAINAAEAASTSPETLLTTAIRRILQRLLSSDDDMVNLGDGSDTLVSLDEASVRIRCAAQLVKAVAATAPNSPPLDQLVSKDDGLCTGELMCLLLRGTPSNSETGSFFGAWDPPSNTEMTSPPKHFYQDTGNITHSSHHNHKTLRLGLLSVLEVEEGVPVCDDLKFADSHTWILHTGDHFLTMRRNDKRKDAQNEILLQIYDGLPPRGPLWQTFALKGDLFLSSPAPPLQPTFRKKKPGQPEDIVQARKTPDSDYQSWSFEVVPAVEDPTVQGPLDDDAREPVYDYSTLAFDETSPWRCAYCYHRRFETMNFGMNESGTTECSVCHQNCRDAMWTLWLDFDDLSPRMQRRARQMYSSPMELLLSTLYPRAKFDLLPLSQSKAVGVAEGERARKVVRRE